MCKTFLNAKGEKEKVDRIVFSPDEKKVALVTGNVINLYDISDLYSSVPQSTNLKQ